MEPKHVERTAGVPPQGPEPSERYDLVLIGSGMGALTVAGLAATMRGKRVLVVERHVRAGGYVHSFRLGGCRFDAGLHYVGQMAEGSPMRRVMDRVTGGRVKWNRLPEPFESFRYPGLRFDLRGGRAEFLESLSARFPTERTALGRYLKDVEKAARGFTLDIVGRNGSFVARAAARLMRPFSRVSGGRRDLTTGDYLRRTFQSPELRAILASQWGTYGLPPGLSPFGLHALIVGHYLEGGWFPEGGGSAVVEAVQAAVSERGGRFLVGHEVTEVLLEGGRAVGVRIRKTGSSEASFDVRCPAVVSDAGLATTYLRLVPPEAAPFRAALAQAVAATEPATGVSLRMRLSGDPRELGLSGGNVWAYDSLDHDDVHAWDGTWVGQSAPPQFFMSFPGMRDPSAGENSAEALSHASFESFAKWRGTDWRRRGPEYEALKERIADDMLAAIEREIPGFSSRVEFRDVSTPLTNESLTGHDRGAYYGLPAIAANLTGEAANWRSPRSPVPGLYLTGADVGSLGVVGAMMGGVTTLSVLPDGVSTLEIMR